MTTSIRAEYIDTDAQARELQSRADALVEFVAAHDKGVQKRKAIYSVAMKLNVSLSKMNYALVLAKSEKRIIILSGSTVLVSK